jgi:glycosyltransferase involved in cell wall biosynthesis
METKKIKLSVALAVYNEEKNLDACLASVSPMASEIVIVDGGSADKTIEIAQKYHAKVIRTDNPPIFHINKQKALDACKSPWILQLDADEIVPEALRNEIADRIEQRQTVNGERFNGYYIPRRNYFLGHFMRKGGQYPDYVIRLVRKGKAKFPCISVHEQIEIDGNVGYLKSPIDHISYRTTGDYWRKAESYTSLTATEMKKSGTPKTIQTWFRYTVSKPVQTFTSLFFRHKGFIDGWYGLVFAWWSALHFPIAYKKFLKL